MISWVLPKWRERGTRWELVTARWRGQWLRERERTTEEGESWMGKRKRWLVCVYLRLRDCCFLFTQTDPNAAELDTVLCALVCVDDSGVVGATELEVEKTHSVSVRVTKSLENQWVQHFDIIRTTLETWTGLGMEPITFVHSLIRQFWIQLTDFLSC